MSGAYKVSSCVLCLMVCFPRRRLFVHLSVIHPSRLSLWALSPFPSFDIQPRTLKLFPPSVHPSLQDCYVCHGFSNNTTLPQARRSKLDLTFQTTDIQLPDKIWSLVTTTELCVGRGGVILVSGPQCVSNTPRINSVKFLKTISAD